MADLVVRAAYASLIEDEEENARFIGFAEGEEEDEPYVLFRQALDGGPIWFEANDENFGAEDAIEQVTRSAKGLDIVIRPASVSRLGWARHIEVRVGPACEDAEPALDALADMLGAQMISA